MLKDAPQIADLRTPDSPIPEAFWGNLRSMLHQPYLNIGALRGVLGSARAMNPQAFDGQVLPYLQETLRSMGLDAFLQKDGWVRISNLESSRTTSVNYRLDVKISGDATTRIYPSLRALVDDIVDIAEPGAFYHLEVAASSPEHESWKAQFHISYAKRKQGTTVHYRSAKMTVEHIGYAWLSEEERVYLFEQLELRRNAICYGEEKEPSQAP